MWSTFNSTFLPQNLFQILYINSLSRVYLSVTRRSAAKAFCRKTCSLSPRTIHIRFRAATAVVDAASNSPPLQFINCNKASRQSLGDRKSKAFLPSSSTSFSSSLPNQKRRSKKRRDQRSWKCDFFKRRVILQNPATLNFAAFRI